MVCLQAVGFPPADGTLAFATQLGSALTATQLDMVSLYLPANIFSLPTPATKLIPTAGCEKSSENHDALYEQRCPLS